MSLSLSLVLPSLWGIVSLVIGRLTICINIFHSICCVLLLVFLIYVLNLWSFHFWLRVATIIFGTFHTWYPSFLCYSCNNCIQSREETIWGYFLWVWVGFWRGLHWSWSIWWRKGLFAMVWWGRRSNPSCDDWYRREMEMVHRYFCIPRTPRDYW